MTFDVGMVAILITILLALLAMAAAWGSLRERVKHNKEAIASDRKTNREDHQQIFEKLDQILRNGHKS